MTTFVFTDEQQDLRAMVRRFLAEKSPVSEVRRLMATEAGYDPAASSGSPGSPSRRNTAARAAGRWSS
jgi:hypothetical protein